MLFQHSYAAFESITACVLCCEEPCSVVECLCEQVLIYNSYAIKDKLRALEFRFDSVRRAWVRSVFEVKRLLELEDHADITLDQILAHSESTAVPSELSSAGELRKPYITCDDDQVCVFDSYDVKDKLKALSFRFDSARAVWSRPTAEVLSLLALDDKADISIQRLLECSAPEVGAADEDGAAGASLEMINNEVLIYNSYAIKDKLRALEFRFNSERRAWVRSAIEVKRLLEVTDHADITLDKILALSESMVPILSPSMLSLSEGASGSDGSPPPIGPELQVDGGNVTVRRCYDIKDQLRSRGFHWDAAGRVWSRTTSEVLLLLGVTNSSQITLDAVLQANETQRGGASPPTAASMPPNIFSTQNTFSAFCASSRTASSSPDLELVAAVEEPEAQNTLPSRNTFSTIAAQGRVAEDDHFSHGAQEESNEGHEGGGGAGGRKRDEGDAQRETLALEGDENCSTPTAALLAKGAGYGEGKSTDGVGGGGGGVGTVPNLCVEGELVSVARCYEIKDQLRVRGFRWDAANRC
jgi:thermostable 8-oxoguanine DNA glycosylase